MVSWCQSQAGFLEPKKKLFSGFSPWLSWRVLYAVCKTTSSDVPAFQLCVEEVFLFFNIVAKFLRKEKNFFWFVCCLNFGDEYFNFCFLLFTTRGCRKKVAGPTWMLLNLLETTKLIL